MSKNQKRQKVTILKGEGVNQHDLEADVLEYKTEKNQPLSEIHVGENGVLRHVDPVGKPAEHHAIPIEKGTWLVGRQVEFNPFTNQISGIFD